MPAGPSVPPLPRGEKIGPAQLAVIADQRKSQCVAVSAEAVDAFSFASLGHQPTSANYSDGVAFQAVTPPGFRFSAMIEVDVEISVRFERPDCPQAIAPRAGERCRICGRRTRAARQQSNGERNQAPRK